MFVFTNLAIPNFFFVIKKIQSTKKIILIATMLSQLIISRQETPRKTCLHKMLAITFIVTYCDSFSHLALLPSLSLELQSIAWVGTPTLHYCTALNCTAVYCRALHYAALHCTALRCTTLHCTALHCAALHCTALHCTALHCTTLHCTALRCTALHCTALERSPDISSASTTGSPRSVGDIVIVYWDIFITIQQ